MFRFEAEVFGEMTERRTLRTLRPVVRLNLTLNLRVLCAFAINPRKTLRFCSSNGSSATFVGALRSPWGFRGALAVAETAIVDEPSKGFDADAALTDVLVAVDAAAERPLRVVQVEHLQSFDADETFELFEDARVALWRHDVVARRQQVTGVEADADTAGMFGARHDVRDLFEGCSEGCSLPGCVLQQDHCLAATARLEKLAQAVRDPVEARAFAPRGVAAGVQHDAMQAERFGAIELVGHRADRLTPQRFIGRVRD